MSTIDPAETRARPRGESGAEGLAGAEDRGGDWQEVLAAQEARVLDLVRAHPVATVALAAAAGFVLARLLREGE